MSTVSNRSLEYLFTNTLTEINTYIVCSKGHGNSVRPEKILKNKYGLFNKRMT